MRTVSTANAAIINGGLRGQHLKVEIKDAGNTWRDMGSYPGYDSVSEATWNDSLDDGVSSADFSFVKELDGLSLAPLMDSGPNKGFNPAAATAPLIAINREIRISVAIIPGDVAAVSGDFEVFFHGRIDGFDASGETVTVNARDLSGQLQDTWIEAERNYCLGEVSGNPVGIRVFEPNTAYVLNEYVMPTEGRRVISGSPRFYKVTTAGTSSSAEPNWPTSGTIASGPNLVFTYQDTMLGTGSYPVEDVMQEILNDNGLSSVTLSTPSSPGWQIGAYKQNRTSVWDALRALALQIGWDLRFAWDSGSSAFVLTFKNPDRGSSTVANTFDAGDYQSMDSLAVDKQNIRNVIRVTYPDSSTLSPGDYAQRKTVERSDATSISKYGRLYAEFAEEKNSNIDTQAEAEALADAALADLKEPTVSHVVTLGYAFPWAELNDRYTFTANDRHYSSNQTLALYAVTHTASGGEMRTQLSCRGTPSAGRRGWLSAIVIPNGGFINKSHAVTVAATKTGTVFAAQATPGGLRVTQTSTPLLQEVYLETEVHLSAVNDFTPSTSTLIDRTASREIEINNLFPGSTYYAKLVPWYRNASKIVRGLPSSQITATTGRASAAFLEPKVDYTLRPLNARLDMRFKDATRADELPDHWNLKAGTLGTTVISKYDDTAGTGNSRSGLYYVRLASSSSTAGIESNAFVVEGGQRYAIRVLAKNVSGTGSWAIKANWKHYDDDDLSTDSFNQSVTDEVGTWFERVEYVTAPAGARYCKLEVTTATTSTQSVDIDTVRIEEVPEIARYYHFPPFGVGQSIANATDTIVNFDDAFDSQTNSNVTTGAAWKYTAPKRGYYLLQTAVTIVYGNNDSGTAYIEVWKNGSAHRRIWRQSGHVLREETQYMASCMLYLNRGDYISVSIYQATGNTRSLEAGTQTYVEIMQVG